MGSWKPLLLVIDNMSVSIHLPISGGFDVDHARTPGPAAYPVADQNKYKLAPPEVRNSYGVVTLILMRA